MKQHMKIFTRYKDKNMKKSQFGSYVMDFVSQ